MIRSQRQGESDDVEDDDGILFVWDERAKVGQR